MHGLYTCGEYVIFRKVKKNVSTLHTIYIANQNIDDIIN
jgi:hypothetical protein